MSAATDAVWDEGELGATNADWLRTMKWDVHLGDKIVGNLADLKKAIAPMTVQHFMTLPAAHAMPKQIRDELSSMKLSKEFVHRRLLQERDEDGTTT